MSYYIDPITELPKDHGEIFSDRNIRITGVARINSSNPNQVITEGVKVYCSPIDGGASAITLIPDGTYTLLGAGSSLWVKVRRLGGSNTIGDPLGTVTPGNGLDIYSAGTQPKSRKDYIQIFYQVAAGDIIAAGDLLMSGQRIYDAIVGDLAYSTHTDLQTAINDVPDNSWILVRQMCLISTTITTAGKSLKIVFSGCGTGLLADGAATGIQLGAPSCQLVGFGTISGFTTGVDLNSQTGTRLEMVFSSNTLNINFGSLTSEEINYHGSYGLSENAHIETATTHGAVGRWNDTKKRWEPMPNVTINDGSTLQAPIVIGAVYQ